MLKTLEKLKTLLSELMLDVSTLEGDAGKKLPTPRCTGRKMANIHYLQMSHLADHYRFGGGFSTIASILSLSPRF